MTGTTGIAGPEPFGTTDDGRVVEAWTLRNASGASVRLCTLGATIVEICVPDREGRLANVVLGFADAAGYRRAAQARIGCTLGRVAGRIAGGRFSLDGREYALSINDPPNHLHGGGRHALSEVLWTAEPIEAGVRFRHSGKDGEEGYPGNVDFSVAFTWSDNDCLRIEYGATSDRATIVNPGNHAYFNLSGAGARDLASHELTIASDHYLPLGEDHVPSGPPAPVRGTDFDFTAPRRICEALPGLAATRARGYDHCFALRAGDGAKAVLRDLASGRVMEVRTSLPGLVLYTGNHLGDPGVVPGAPFPMHGAVCLEAQHFPDAINRGGDAADAVVLRPGDVYRHHCSYVFSVEATSPGALAGPAG